MLSRVLSCALTTRPMQSRSTWWESVFFFSSRRRHTRCALVTGVQTCALPISFKPALDHDPLAELAGEAHAAAATKVDRRRQQFIAVVAGDDARGRHGFERNAGRATLHRGTPEIGLELGIDRDAGRHPPRPFDHHPPLAPPLPVTHPSPPPPHTNHRPP